jgi:hypothetical protein
MLRGGLSPHLLKKKPGARVRKRALPFEAQGRDESNSTAGWWAKKPVKLGAGTAVQCPYMTNLGPGGARKGETQT